jgi:hypothetical protein
MRYKNELILLGSIIFMLLSYNYKYKIEHQRYETAAKIQQDYADIIKASNLQNIWSNKKSLQKTKELKALVSPSKVEWSQKSKKLHIKYKSLNKNELNRVLNKLLNLPVQIKTIDIKRKDKVYNMELQCKW